MSLFFLRQGIKKSQALFFFFVHSVTVLYSKLSALFFLRTDKSIIKKVEHFFFVFAYT